MSQSIAAVVQLAVLLAAMTFAVRRSSRYPVFLLSLAASIPFTWFSAVQYAGNHAAWERTVWLPCAILLIPAQAIATLEAFFCFGRFYVLAPRISATLAIFSASATLAFLSWPHGGAVSQVVQTAMYQRVGCGVFLILACGFYASVKPRELLTRVDGRHLLLITVWLLTWMIPSIRRMPTEWVDWLSVTWMYTARSVILLVWVFAVPLSGGQSRFDSIHARVEAINATLDPAERLK